MHRQDFDPILISVMKNIQSANGKLVVCACVFCVSRALNILNGYDLGGWMKQAKTSDSKNTCVKVKSDFQNRNKTKITKVPFFRDTLYIQSSMIKMTTDFVEKLNLTYFQNRNKTKITKVPFLETPCMQILLGKVGRCAFNFEISNYLETNIVTLRCTFIAST